MILERARLIRAKMEQTAAEWDDAIALDFTEFFPLWVTEHVYQMGDRVRDEDVLYKCVQSHTSQSDWRPSITPNLWTIVSIEEWPEWVQPIGASDVYAKGDKVSHNGKHWVSDYDGNSWEPGVFGWTEVPPIA